MADAQRKLRDIVGDAETCMLVDRFQAGLRARPMAPHTDEGSDIVWMVTDVNSGKVDEVARNPEVCLSIQDGQTYASVTGHAEIVDDLAKKKEIWNPFVDAWFPEGPESASATLLKITPQAGEYWDAPSKLVQSVKMLIASATDERPDDMGDNEKVRFS